MPDRVATLAQNFEAQAQKYGARAFLKDKRDKVWTDHSWSDVSEAAGKLRAGLLGLGVCPGRSRRDSSRQLPRIDRRYDQAVLGLGAIVMQLYTTSGLGRCTRHQRLGRESHRGEWSRDGEENPRPQRLDSRGHRGCRDASRRRIRARRKRNARRHDRGVAKRRDAGGYRRGQPRRPRDPHLYVGHDRTSKGVMLARRTSRQR